MILSVSKRMAIEEEFSDTNAMIANLNFNQEDARRSKENGFGTRIFGKSKASINSPKKPGIVSGGSKKD